MKTKPKLQLYEAEIKYQVKGKEIEFAIVHNIPNDVNIAFESWAYRTKEHTAESLCEYLKAKDITTVALTKHEYEQFNTTQNGNT